MSNRLATTADKIGASVGLDPIVLIAAIQAITTLITLCVQDRTPEGIARAAKRPRRRQRKAMTNAVRRELDSRGQADKLAITMAALHLEIQSLTTAELAEICEECSSLTADYN